MPLHFRIVFAVMRRCIATRCTTRKQMKANAILELVSWIRIVRWLHEYRLRCIFWMEKRKCKMSRMKWANGNYNWIMRTWIILVVQHSELIVKVNYERSSCHDFCMRVVDGAFHIHAFSIDTLRAVGQSDNFGRTRILCLDDGRNNISSILFCQRKTFYVIAKSRHQPEIEKKKEKKFRLSRAHGIIIIHIHNQ